MNSAIGSWYPGFGEVELIRRMPPELRGFLSDACAGDPSFVSEYLIPALRRPDAYTRIMEDILNAVEHQDGAVVCGFLGGVDFRKFSGLGATATDSAATISSKIADARAKIQAAIEKAKKDQEIQNQAQVALAKARLQQPKPLSRDEQWKLQQEAFSIAKDAAAAAAEKVKAAGGTAAEQKAAALKTAVNVASQVKDAVQAVKVEEAKKSIATADSYMKSQWYYNLPWYAAYDSSRTTAPFRRASDIDWMMSYVKKHGESSFPEPPASAPEHSAWWQVMLRVYGREKYPPPPQDSPLYAQYKEAYARATHPGGDFGAVARVLTAPIRFVARNAKAFGNILINVIGAVLSPFTGGASLVAAGLLTAANSARMAANAARAAKKAAAADAAQKEQVAAQQTAETERQVNAFYSSNQGWFLEHGITPDKWASLNLDQKVAVIQAGASGTFPSEPQPILSSAGQPYLQPARTLPHSSSGGAQQPSYDSGGASGGGGTYPDGSYPSGGFPTSQPQQAKVPASQAGMFGGATVPLLAAGIGLALVFGKPANGSHRKARRNPKRRLRASA